MLLNPDGAIKPKTREYRTLLQLIAHRIDRLGPDAALAQIQKNKAQILKQLRMMTL